MEQLSQIKHEAGIDRLGELSRRIEHMYAQAAGQYLEEGDPLRNRIVGYYSARPETEQELLTVLEKKNEGELSDYIKSVKEFTEDSRRFVEHMERLYEIQDVHRRRKELALQDRLATDEEYELGVYADVLESQVRDAVLVARKKGYLTFQSGFKEKSERDQFMDFYNKSVVIPEEIVGYLQNMSIEAKVENFEDRTTLTLHPVGRSPIRLAQWKEIWDTLIESLPQASPETVSNAKQYGEHLDFRRKQDLLRKQ